MNYTTEVVQQTRLQVILHTYQDMLHHLLHSVAFWVFCAVWVLSALTLLVTGYLDPLIFLQTALVLLFCLVTVALTARAPTREQTEAPGASRKWVWAQLAVLLVFILFTAYRGMMFHHTAGGWLAQLPGVSWLANVLNSLPKPFTTMATNPILYFVLPVIALRLLRAGWRELGFRRGYRTWAVIACWGILPVAVILLTLVGGQMTLAMLALSLVSNSLNNGFFEEFLFRGALLTRLSRLWGSDWGIVLSSLLFGIWHIGVVMSQFPGNPLAALAFTIVVQATIGLGFAIVFVRTRNLLAPSVIHVLVNTNVLGVV
jgi:membrane protease YdiL (CAAX protease family)